MDGIHDVGGEQGFGRVKPTADELPFEHDWEGRMLGIVLAITRSRDWNVDKFRFTREQLPPVEYLTRPYFDQWYRSYAAMLLGSGLVTAEELATGRSARAAPALGKPMSRPCACQRLDLTATTPVNRALASAIACVPISRRSLVTLACPDTFADMSASSLAFMART